MQTQLRDKLKRNIEALSPEDQKKAIDYIEKLARRSSADRLSIFEAIDDIVDDIPVEDFTEIPSDSSLNVDHYLYGSSKR